MRLDVSIDIERAKARLTDIGIQVRQKAVTRALNKTADQAKVQAAREIQSAYPAMKIAAIKKAITIKRATPTQLVATLKAVGRPIPLVNFGARQVKSGVSVQVRGQRKIVKHAFIATMPNGHRGVYERLGTQHRWVKRAGKRVHTGLPIAQLFGPAIPSMFLNDTVMNALHAAIRDRFPRILAAEIQYLRLK